MRLHGRDKLFERASHTYTPPLALGCGEPNLLAGLQLVVVDLQLDREPWSAVRTLLQDEDVRSAGHAAPGLVGAGFEGSAARRAVDKHVVRLSPTNTLHLQFCFGIVVPLIEV